ncbi:ACT domain-containing protein [candidate division KSB1 bacterium]|nr:ACT domain-containing protein [candidate division KSB1 bacterium]
MENAFVYRIAHDTTEARLTVLGVPDKSGIGAKIFHAFAEAKIDVDMIIYNKVTDGSPNVSFIIPKADVIRGKQAAESVANEIGAEGVMVEEDIARISVIGRGLHNPSGLVAKMFEAFGDERINIQMISTAETRLCCLIKAEEVERAVKTLIKKFDLDKFRGKEMDIAPKEEVDFALPFDAPFDYTLIHG